MKITQALDDPKVFGPFFRGPTWAPWRVFLAALFAQPMSAEQLAIYAKHTGRSAPPKSPSHEAWLCIGRRGGKSFIFASSLCTSHVSRTGVRVLVLASAGRS